MKNQTEKIGSGYRAAWWVTSLLLLINLLNFIDRMIPAVLLEDIRKAYGLNDLWMGILVSGFIVVFALSGLPLGRLADRWIRKNVLAGGAILWSLFTALSGLASGFAVFFIARLGVGIGEASYAPAATSMITDMFPSAKRGRAMGLFMLGLPIGISLSFIIIAKVKASAGSWQAPFIIAGAFGVVIGSALLLIVEPRRGASDGQAMMRTSLDMGNPFRTIFRIPTVLWITLSGITVNMASYGTNTFFKALLERYYGLSALDAGWTASAVLGVTGLLAMTAGAYIADKLQARSANGRLKLAAYSMLAAAPIVAIALCETRGGSMTRFVTLYSIGWFLFYFYYVSVYTSLQEIVAAHLRASVMSVYFLGQYLIGSTLGTTMVGGLSDLLAREEMASAGATLMTDFFRGEGLHMAMFIVPSMLLITGLVLLAAGRAYLVDLRRAKQTIGGTSAPISAAIRLTNKSLNSI